MTDQEAKAIATIIAGSELVYRQKPHDPRYSAAEKRKVERMTTKIGRKLLARYGRDQPVSTDWEAKRYILQEYYD